MLSGLYPALGGADAWNQGGDRSRSSPPLNPHRVRIFLRKFSVYSGNLLHYINQLILTENCFLVYSAGIAGPSLRTDASGPFHDLTSLVQVGLLLLFKL